MNKYQQAAKAFIEATQGDVVSEEVIAHRSRICKGCPARVKSILGGVVARALKNAPPELKGYVCGICKCPLALLIPAKEPHIDSPKEEARRRKVNPRCWNLP